MTLKRKITSLWINVAADVTESRCGGGDSPSEVRRLCSAAAGLASPREPLSILEDVCVGDETTLDSSSRPEDVRNRLL